jgi:predicted nucleic acid-binding protein
VIVYADSSALVKLLLREDGSSEFSELVESCDVLFSVAIAYVELRAALAAAARGGRIPADQRGVMTDRLESVWRNVSEITVDAPLIREAGDLAEVHALRGYDAVHLAGYSRVSDDTGISFACWDERLREAARVIGCTHTFPA